MKHLKITSVLLSITMCASMVMTPVSVIADDSAATSETQTVEVTEQEETKKETPKETEKPAPKDTEKQETEAPEKAEPAETEKQEPEKTEKETETAETQETEAVPTDKSEETEGQKSTETEKQEPSATEQTEPEIAETQEPAQTEKEEPEETVAEVKPEKGPVTTTRKKASNGTAFYKDQDTTRFGTTVIEAPNAPDVNKAWTGSYVYFGTYNGEPIKFRVLAPKTTAYGGTTMLLDSDATLFKNKFAYSNVWPNSEIKSYLNKEFLESFTSAEEAVIAKSTRNAHALSVGTTAGKVSPDTKSLFANYVALKGEKVFLLDAEEASNINYGYSLTDSKVANREKTGASTLWWLRSAKNGDSDNAGYVSVYGDLDYSYGGVNLGIAPALNINLSSILFSSLIPGTLHGFHAEYKLTIKDPNLTIAVPAGQKAEVSGTTVSIPYSIGGKNAGSANSVSYLITNKAYTDIKYYEVLTKSSGTSGTISFELPSNLSLDKWGIDYDVYILAEQANGAHMTDYASVPVKVASPYDNTLTVTPKTAKVKYKKLRKKKQTVARSKVMNVQYAQGKVTYKLTGVKRGKSKKYKKYFKINSTTGKVTIKKRLKKGTYKVTCKVTAAGDSYYRSGTRTVTFTIKVK